MSLVQKKKIHLCEDTKVLKEHFNKILCFDIIVEYCEQNNVHKCNVFIFYWNWINIFFFIIRKKSKESKSNLFNLKWFILDYKILCKF